MISFNAKVTINGLQQKAEMANKSAQMQLDNDVLKDSNYYAPKDTGNLEASSLSSSLIGQGMLYWNTPYARRLYYNPQYNFARDKNPNAQGLWFEAAKASKKDSWLENMRNEYRKYFSGK